MTDTVAKADFGVIVAKPIEQAAVLCMLDSYEAVTPTIDDPNFYWLGTLKTKPGGRAPSVYRMVVAMCPKMGNNGAAMVSKDLMRTFGVRHVIMVGIAAGIPCVKTPGQHVRLGDVVVSYGRGVIQYDLTKRYPDGRMEIRSALPSPSRSLLAAVDLLEAARLTGSRPWENYFRRAGGLGRRPDPSTDKLYTTCGKKRTYWRRIPHPIDARPKDQPKIHYGLIGSGNCLMKDVRARDKLASELGILAIEMEGAGVADASWHQTEISDYLIIRGVSDYADRHKSDDWHSYAAVAASAYLRALIEIEPVPPIARREHRFGEIELEDGEISRSLSSAVTRYIRWVKNFTNSIVIRVGERAIELPLATTFVCPDISTTHVQHATRPLSELETESVDFYALWPTDSIDRSSPSITGDPIKVSAEEIIRTDTNVMLLGPAGSGKSTVLRYVAQILASRILDEAEAPTEDLATQDRPSLPAIVPLNAFANYLENLADDAEPHERTLLHFAQHYLVLRQANLRLPSNFLEDLLVHDYELILLLDALDEVADESQRIQISRAIQDLAQVPHPPKLVVTSRRSAYHGETVLASSFQSFNILPMNPELVRTMISKICHRIYSDQADRQRNLDEMIQSIETLEERRRTQGLGRGRLVETPLMVQILVTLFIKGGRIAQQRTRLFQDYVDACLRSLYGPDTTVALRLSKLAGSIELQRSLLGRVAFELHMCGERGTVSLDTMDLERLVAHHLEGIPGLEDVGELARQFLEYHRLRGGLLTVEDKRTAFGQMAFQEFLAGQYLDEHNARPEDIVTFLERGGRIASSWWYEPTIHAIGLMHSQNEKRARQFVEKLAHINDSNSPENPVYIAELSAAGEACVEHRFDPSSVKRIAERISDRVLHSESVKSVSLVQRADLGRILGMIGDPRPDVMCKIPTTIKMEKGRFMMGHHLNESLRDLPSLQSGQYEVDVNVYWISKYPITNHQFEYFVLAGGYSLDGRRFWTEAGWEWKSRFNISCPAYWGDIDWRIQNHPVVGISWFEAVAYCRWLSEVTGRRFRLPTEAEWEKAASGKGSWPWGSQFDAEPSNTSESGIGRPTCVGLFIGSASSSGVHDMAGNVWQWCNSEFRTYDRYEPEDGRESTDGSSPRCIRAGSWLNNKDRARVANRDHYYPGDRHFDLGFRVVEMQ